MDALAGSIAQEATEHLRSSEGIATGTMAIGDRDTIVRTDGIKVPPRQVSQEPPSEPDGAQLVRHHCPEGHGRDTPELGVEEAEIEARIVGDEDPPEQVRSKLTRNLLKPRRSPNHGIVNPRQARDVPGNRAPGVDERVKREPHPLPVHMDRRHLGDAVASRRLAAGGLDVHDHEREGVEFHVVGIYRATPIERLVASSYACEGFHNLMHPLSKPIAESTIRRLSLYLRFLEEFEARGQATVSSGELARSGGTTSAQVRKDLSFFGSFGKRGLGYGVKDLMASIREILGLEHPWNVVIIGAGKIGAALAQYRGFTTRGFHVIGIYDSDPLKVGTDIGGMPVRDSRDLEADIAARTPRIAVLCVPGDAAQAVVDRVVAAGVTAILSFAPVPLHAPDGVSLRAVNMATELEILTYSLTHAQ